MKRKEFATTVRANIKAVQAMGWTIHQALTLEADTHQVCAIGAWGVVNGIMLESVDDLGRRMGLTEGQTASFIYGFDGMSKGSYAVKLPKWYDLGKKLWAELQAEPAPVG